MINVLIPMGGKGSRFQQRGYTFPKPLIEVNRKPMIQKVVENLGVQGRYIFLVSKEHYDNYTLQYLLPLIVPDCKSEIIVIDEMQPGAAAASLLATDLIDNNSPLVIANADQLFETPFDFGQWIIDKGEDYDGAILTFESIHPKWSFAKTDEFGFVTAVAEKKPISNKATIGVYHWNKGSDYIKYTKQMIEKDIRVNGEFYICPVYNQAIQDGKKIITIPTTSMWGLGTPEDLDYYLLHNMD